MTAPDDWDDPLDPEWDDHDPAEWFPPGGIAPDEYRDIGGWRPVRTVPLGGDLL